MTACGVVGALMVGGRVVGQVRCDLEAGHELVPPTIEDPDPTSHAMTLTWTPEAEPDLDLFDPDEIFDADPLA